MSQKGKALKSNKLRVLGEICSGRNVTRTELAEAIGMTPMSVSTIVRELKDEDILIETQGNKKETQLGRKPQILELSPKCPCVLAMNLSREMLQIAVMDLRAGVRKEWHREVPEIRTADDVKRFIFSAVDGVMDGTTCKIAGIGISTFGPVNTERGVILNPRNFHDVGNISLKEPLAERYKLPVVMLHDTTASALAENRFGHPEADSLIYILINSGIGCGLVIDRRIFGGENGLSGELGHMSIAYDGPKCQCSARGCLETYVTIPKMTEGINRRYGFVPRLTWQEIIERFNEDGTEFREEFERYGDYFAAAIISMANLLDISTFILDYQGQECGDRFEKLIEKKVREGMLVPEEKNFRILKSTYGSLSGVIGACSAVVTEMINGNIDLLDL